MRVFRSFDVFRFFFSSARKEEATHSNMEEEGKGDNTLTHGSMNINEHIKKERADYMNMIFFFLVYELLQLLSPYPFLFSDYLTPA